MNNKRNGGYALLEVMIGLFVLAIGLLGMASLQGQAVRVSNSAHLYSQASYLASDMVERMRANREQLADYSLLFSDTVTAAVDCAASNCTPEQLAKWDQSRWLADLAERLPQGAGNITVAGTKVTIQIRFDDNKGSQTGSQENVADALIQFQLDSQI
mgnify:CR=1 FL=1